MSLSPVKRLIGAAAVLTLLLSVGARADVPITYTDGGRALFSVNAPDFWSIRTGGPRELTAPGTDTPRNVARVVGMQPVTEQRIWVGFVSPHGVATLAQARSYLQDIGPFLVKDAQVDQEKSRRIGGRSATSFTGKGRRDGKSVNFTAVVIDLPGARVAIAIVVLEAGVDPEIVNDVNGIFASFRALQ